MLYFIIVVVQDKMFNVVFLSLWECSISLDHILFDAEEKELKNASAEQLTVQVMLIVLQTSAVWMLGTVSPCMLTYSPIWSAASSDRPFSFTISFFTSSQDI